jgi:hypothetical protein
MQRIIGIVAIIIMGVLFVMSLTAENSGFVSEASVVVLSILMIKKGMERSGLRDVFNLRKEHIRLFSNNTFIELILSIEFIMVNTIDSSDIRKFIYLSEAIISTLTSVVIIIVGAMLFFRFFFLNMFNEEKIDYSRTKKYRKK